MFRENKIISSKLLGLFLGVILAVGFGVIVPAAHADELNQSTKFTFTAPVEIPGHVVLPAGTYWFQIMPEHSRYPNIVRIFDADHTKVVASLLTDAIQRSGPYPDIYFHSGNSELIFAERPNGRPMALMEWYYPDRITGHQFIYSNQLEKRLSADRQVTITAKG